MSPLQLSHSRRNGVNAHLTDRIKSKQILHSLIIDAIEKCRIEYNYL